MILRITWLVCFLWGWSIGGFRGVIRARGSVFKVLMMLPVLFPVPVAASGFYFAMLSA